MNQEIKEGLNTGFIEQAPRATDFMAGAETALAAAVQLPTGDWTPYLPQGERQSSRYFDTMACVSFSALNIIEAQINLMLASGKVPQDVQDKMRTLGYLNASGQVNFSDRFTAKMSGTTRVGNYFVAVWDSIRHHGLLPETDWPKLESFEWDDYYAEVPQALKDKALEFLKLFEIRYEWLVTGGQATSAQYREWLKVSPLQIASAICSGWNDGGVVKSCPASISHATTMTAVTDQGVSIFDHYMPFQKVLESDFRIPYVMRGIVTVKGLPPVDMTFAKKFAGMLILAVEERGALYYVTPEGRRAKIGTKSEEVEAFLQGIRDKRIPHVGMKNVDLNKIPTI